MPRGRGWHMSTNTVAANIAGTTVGETLDAEQIAKRAADIIDAVYREKKERNALGLGDAGHPIVRDYPALEGSTKDIALTWEDMGLVAPLPVFLNAHDDDEKGDD